MIYAMTLYRWDSHHFVMTGWGFLITVLLLGVATSIRITKD